MEGSVGLALFSASAFLGGLLIEKVLLLIRWRPYFALSLRLEPQILPIPSVPEGEGRTASVAWCVNDAAVLFWADPARREAPMLLRGVIRFYPSGDRFSLSIGWCPPWSPLLAAAWLGGLGLYRGEAHVTVPIACAIVMGVLVLYRQAAIRAASELRWAFVRVLDEDEVDRG